MIKNFKRPVSSVSSDGVKSATMVTDAMFVIVFSMTVRVNGESYSIKVCFSENKARLCCRARDMIYSIQLIIRFDPL